MPKNRAFRISTSAASPSGRRL